MADGYNINSVCVAGSAFHLTIVHGYHLLAASLALLAWLSSLQLLLLLSAFRSSLAP